MTVLNNKKVKYYKKNILPKNCFNLFSRQSSTDAGALNFVRKYFQFRLNSSEIHDFLLWYLFEFFNQFLTIIHFDLRQVVGLCFGQNVVETVEDSDIFVRQIAAIQFVDEMSEKHVGQSKHRHSWNGVAVDMIAAQSWIKTVWNSIALCSWTQKWVRE